MNLVPYQPELDLTNQFTCTQGPTGSGKSTFGLSVCAGIAPLLVIDFDRRSYSARRTAMQKFGAQFVEIPGLQLDPSDKRSMDEIMDKKAITKKSKKGNEYEVWQIDYEHAKEVRASIEEYVDYLVACDVSEIGGLFIDDAKWLGRIWAASLYKGQISSIPKMDWGSVVYPELMKTMVKLTRGRGCDKDVLLAHHQGAKYVNDENTGENEPKWVDRVVKLADNVIEHGTDPRTFEIWAEFNYKVPADNIDFFGKRIVGVECLQYNIIKMALLGELELPE